MKKGFTIVELLVVAAITALVSGIVISYSRIGENQAALYVETQKIASSVLRAKSLAITTFGRGAVGGGAMLCGYGFDIDYQNRSYRIFSYELAASNCSNIDSIRSSSRVELPNSVFSLPRGVSWDEKSDSLRTVLFVPPVPKTLISADPDSQSVGAAQGKIYLKTADGAQTVITVGAAGQVDF